MRRLLLLQEVPLLQQSLVLWLAAFERVRHVLQMIADGARGKRHALRLQHRLYGLTGFVRFAYVDVCGLCKRANNA